MELVLRIVGFGMLAISLGASPAATQVQPQEVTTDTPEYCLHLRSRVTELMRGSVVPPPHEVVSLSTEGQRMCDQGQTRGGIMRLRRALVMLMNWTAGP